MDFGALQTDLVQTMTLELTNYMTIYDQSFKNSRFWGGKKVPITQDCHRN